MYNDHVEIILLCDILLCRYRRLVIAGVQVEFSNGCHFVSNHLVTFTAVSVTT